MAPFYDYVCEDCKTEREEYHSMRDTPEFRCAQCGSEKPLKRTISDKTSFALKGGGWSTDNYGFVSRGGTKR